MSVPEQGLSQVSDEGNAVTVAASLTTCYIFIHNFAQVFIAIGAGRANMHRKFLIGFAASGVPFVVKLALRCIACARWADVAAAGSGSPVINK